MAAAFGMARVSPNVPQRFYSDGGSDAQVSGYWHGRQYDHVQAWVNSLPQPAAPLQPPPPPPPQQHFHQQQQRPGVTADASFASRSQPSSGQDTQTSRLPDGLDYVTGDLQSNRNAQGRQSAVGIGKGVGGGREQQETRDGKALLLMKANYCSLSSDASAVSSVEEILNERKGNPEELLQFLGFGSQGSSLASRLPARFLLSPSHARGVQTDTIIARHPELLALKEPETDALSATLLDKLPSYYQRELPPGEAADSFSSLHRRFSARLSAAGEVAQQLQQQRRESISWQRYRGSGHHRGHSALTAQASVGSKGQGHRLQDGKKVAGEETTAFHQGFMHATVHTGAAGGPTAALAASAAVASQQHGGPATAERCRMTTSLSSMSDSVFMSNSDGAGDDYSDDLECTFDMDRWPCDYADLAAGMSGGGSKPPLRRADSDSRPNGRGLGMRLQSSVGGGRCGGTAALLQKHRSFDALELPLPSSQQYASAFTGVRPKLAMPDVTVLVTSEDGELATPADDADGTDCGGTRLLRGQLLVKADCGHLQSVGSRTPTAASPSFLSVVDSFESCESDTQTITGDVLDDCLSSVTGGGAVAAGVACCSAANDDTNGASIARTVAAAASGAVNAAGGSCCTSSSRLHLAVVPAMESFEMEEVQSIGDPTRPRHGGSAPMNRSQSAQSDSSGFADTEDDRQQVSPPATFTSKEVPDADGDSDDERRCTAVLLPGINKMADVVGALLNVAAQKKRQVLSREHHIREPTSPGSATEAQSLAALASAVVADDEEASARASSTATTDDEYSSAVDMLERMSSRGLQSECDGGESEEVLPRRASELYGESVSVWQDPAAAVRHADDDVDAAGCCRRDDASAATSRRVTSIRSGPLAQWSTTMDGPSAMSSLPHRPAATCRLTVHGAPLARQCAVDLNVALPLPDAGALRRTCVAGSLVVVEEAEAEESCSISREPEALQCLGPDDCVVVDSGVVDVVTRETVSCAEQFELPSGRDSHSTVTPLRPAPLLHGYRRGSGAVSASGGSDVSGHARSTASDTSSSVLLALLKPGYGAVTAESEGDIRLVQRAVQRYRATAYETDAALDARIQSLPDDLRSELLDELQLLEDVRQSVAREAVQLEGNVLEKLEATRMPKSASRCTSPLSAMHSPAAAPTTQGLLPLVRPPSAAECSSSSKPSSANVVEECTKLLKEQIYHQKLLESKDGLALASAAFCNSSGAPSGSLRHEVASLQHQVDLLETKQKYEQRISELEVTTLKLMLQAKEEEIKRLKLLTDID